MAIATARYKYLDGSSADKVNFTKFNISEYIKKSSENNVASKAPLMQLLTGKLTKSLTILDSNPFIKTVTSTLTKACSDETKLKIKNTVNEFDRYLGIVKQYSSSSTTDEVCNILQKIDPDKICSQLESIFGSGIEDALTVDQLALESCITGNNSSPISMNNVTTVLSAVTSMLYTNDDLGVNMKSKIQSTVIGHESDDIIDAANEKTLRLAIKTNNYPLLMDTLESMNYPAISNRDLARELMKNMVLPKGTKAEKEANAKKYINTVLSKVNSNLNPKNMLISTTNESLNEVADNFYMTTSDPLNREANDVLSWIKHKNLANR